MNKKFIFVAGPSESGKSGAVNYLADNNEEFKHLKIRNIFPEVYKDSKSSLEYSEWYDDQSKNNFEEFWQNYIQKASTMAGDAKVVIMDTMYGLKEIKYLYELLGEDLRVLYIDAPLEKRIMREYMRLRTDSSNSDRKADLEITIEEVTEKTKKKDAKKQRLETFEYKNLRYNDVGGIDYNASGNLFSYVIENGGSREELNASLDTFSQKILSEVKGAKIKK